jgi:hypothetical protein
LGECRTRKTVKKRAKFSRAPDFKIVLSDPRIIGLALRQSVCTHPDRSPRNPSAPTGAAHRLSERPPGWLRAAAVSGFAVSLLYTILSVFPIIDVPSWKVFAVKIIVVLVGANLLGVGIYVVGRRRAGPAAAT